MNGFQATPKKHYADTILAICVAAFILIAIIVCSAGFDIVSYLVGITQAKLIISAICFVLFVIFAFASAYLEMRYLGWQEIHLLPAASVFIGIASVLINVMCGWFFIVYGFILGIYYIVKRVREGAESRVSGLSDVPEEKESVAMFGTGTDEAADGSWDAAAPAMLNNMSVPGNMDTAEPGTGDSTQNSAVSSATTGNSAGMRGTQDGLEADRTVIVTSTVQNENFMESDAPDPEQKTWKEYFEDGLVLANMISGTEYYVMDTSEGVMYHYNKLLKQLEKCGTGESPELNDEVKAGHKEKVQDFVTTAIEGEMGARVWNREKNKYCQSLIRLESTDRYPGIRLISVIDVSESVEDLRDNKRELKKMITGYERQIRILEDDEKRVFFSINELMSSLVEAKSEESHAHIQSVCKFTEAILKEAEKLYPELGIDERFIADVSNATILHDIGKILVPDSILQNKGTLSPEEYEIMKKHPEYGAEIINRMPYVRNEEETMKMAHEIALHHHERADGSGYPHGLKAEDTPFYVQAVAISDAYDGLTAKRSYKKSCSHYDAYNMIVNGECGQFSDRIIACFGEAQESFIEIRIAIN